MLRTLALALAFVVGVVAAPAAQAKKHRAHARPGKHAAKHTAKASKRARPGDAMARVEDAPPPTRVASAAEHPAPAVAEHPAPAHATPAPEVAPAPSPPVEHGPLGPQDADDEVPGSRAKKR